MGISHPFPAQARMLLGKPCVAAAALVPGDVALATQRLRTMRFVGLFEDWATSACLFHRALRLPAPSKAEVADVRRGPKAPACVQIKSSTRLQCERIRMF